MDTSSVATGPVYTRDLRTASADPTGTGQIRRSWRSAAKLRIRLARAAIRQAIMETDILGLGQASPLAIHGADVRLDAFRHLVMHAINRQLMGEWALPFIRAAWHKGITEANAGVRAAVPDAAVVETLLGHELQALITAVALAVTRVGMKHPPSKANAWQMAAAIYDKEMTKRLPALIDTLTIKSYNRAKIEGYRARGHTHVGIIPETKPRARVRDAWEESESGNWVFKRSKRAKGRLEAEFEGELVCVQTAGDDRVCDDCDDIADDSPYELDEAMDLLPVHIGCRCAIVEWHDKSEDALPNFLILPVAEVQDAGWSEEARKAALEARLAKAKAKEEQSADKPRLVEYTSGVAQGNTVRGVEVPRHRPDGASVSETPAQGTKAERMGWKTGQDVTFTYNSAYEARRFSGKGFILGFVSNARSPSSLRQGNKQDIVIAPTGKHEGNIYFVAERGVFSPRRK